MSDVPPTPIDPTPVDLTQQPATRALAAHDRYHALARAALAVNAGYLAVASPTGVQVAAQVAALTRQMNGLIRLVIAGDLLANDPTP